MTGWLSPEAQSGVGDLKASPRELQRWAGNYEPVNSTVQRGKVVDVRRPELLMLATQSE